VTHEITTEPEIDMLGATWGADRPERTALPAMVSAADLYKRDLRDLRPLLQGLAWDGLRMLIARPKAGKSWLTLQAAIHIAGGVLFRALPHLTMGRFSTVLSKNPPLAPWHDYGRPRYPATGRLNCTSYTSCSH
jgi:AAA domain-containing protein